MNIHKNARLTLHGRERIVRQVESGRTPQAVAEAAGVCPRTVRKWVERYRREGGAGLQDRSSRPHRLRRPTPETVVAEIERLRRQRWTGKQIAAATGVSPATVSRVLHRLGLNKFSALEPEPVRRYEREHAGELIHLDIKKLGRIGSVGHRITGRYPGAVNRHLGIGWEFVHVCIDNASRVAFAQVMPDQRTVRATAQALSGQPANVSACARSSPSPIRRRPTGKPSASFRPAGANGPMPAPTTPQTNAPPNCRDGFTATIGIDLMAVSAQNHLSADSV